MKMVKEKLAEHGTVYFAHHQTNGRGTRGKDWATNSHQNITLSIVLEVQFLAIQQQFLLSASIALAVYDFFYRYASKGTSIKWPNDIFFNDSKAAGILIENSIIGKNWKWAVVGIGININQTNFDTIAPNAISLATIKQQQFNVVALAKELCTDVQNRLNALQSKSFSEIIDAYNTHLYKKNECVKLKQDDVIFDGIIKEVTPAGALIVDIGVPTMFEFGEVQWEINKNI